MAKKKKEEAAPSAEGAEKAPKSKKNMVIAVVGALAVFVAGGKLMGGGSTGPTKTVIKIVTTTTTIPVGEVVALDAITLNLSDGHLLKVGIGFQLEYEKPAAAAEGEAAPAADSTDPTKGYAKALDIVIDELSKHTMEELSGAGRNVAKAQLVKRLKKVTHGKIEDVYFHQFVMQ
jgi:flagellar protein FliL